MKTTRIDATLPKAHARRNRDALFLAVADAEAARLALAEKDDVESAKDYAAACLHLADTLRADGQWDIAGTWDEEYRLTMEAVNVQ